MYGIHYLLHARPLWLVLALVSCSGMHARQLQRSLASLIFCLHGTAQIRSSEPKDELSNEMFFEIQNTSFYLLQVNEGSLDLFVREKEK
jgi:hypothetical protein